MILCLLSATFSVFVNQFLRKGIVSSLFFWHTLSFHLEDVSSFSYLGRLQVVKILLYPLYNSECWSEWQDFSFTDGDTQRQGMTWSQGKQPR